MIAESVTIEKRNHGSASDMLRAQKARQIAEFCIRAGGKAFAGWEPLTVFSYVFYHLAQRTLFCEQKDGQILGVLIIWGEPAASIQRKAAASQPAFDWMQSNDKADSLYLAEVVSNKERLHKLFKQAANRFPKWNQKTIYTQRLTADKKLELVQLSQDTIKRLIYGKEQQHGR